MLARGPVSSPGGSSFQLYPALSTACFFRFLSLFFPILFVFFGGGRGREGGREERVSRSTFFGRPIEFRSGTTSLKSHSRSKDTTSLSMDDFKRYHLFEVTFNGTRRAFQTFLRETWRDSKVTRNRSSLSALPRLSLHSAYAVRGFPTRKYRLFSLIYPRGDDRGTITAKWNKEAGFNSIVEMCDMKITKTVDKRDIVSMPS